MHTSSYSRMGEEEDFELFHGRDRTAAQRPPCVISHLKNLLANALHSVKFAS